MVKLDRDTKGKVTKIVTVSFRWVKECISKKNLIDPKDGESYIYRPLPLVTPMVHFCELIFDVIGVSSVKKQKLKELYNALGSVKNLPNKKEVTHCLCG